MPKISDAGAGVHSLGGVGFVVLSELVRWPRGRRISLHTKLVLTLTPIFILGTTVAVLILERQNEATVGALPHGEALMAALFHAVTPRTAGFNTLDVGAMLPATLFVTVILMFIGAAPGGTAGGREDHNLQHHRCGAVGDRPREAGCCAVQTPAIRSCADTRRTRVLRQPDCLSHVGRRGWPAARHRAATASADSSRPRPRSARSVCRWVKAVLSALPVISQQPGNCWSLR